MPTAEHPLLLPKDQYYQKEDQVPIGTDSSSHHRPSRGFPIYTYLQSPKHKLSAAGKNTPLLEHETVIGSGCGQSACTPVCTKAYSLCPKTYVYAHTIHTYTKSIQYVDSQTEEQGWGNFTHDCAQGSKLYFFPPAGNVSLTPRESLPSWLLVVRSLSRDSR